MIKFHYKSDDNQAPAYLAKIKSEPVEYTGAWNRLMFKKLKNIKEFWKRSN